MALSRRVASRTLRWSWQSRIYMHMYMYMSGYVYIHIYFEYIHDKLIVTYKFVLYVFST